MYNLGGHHEVTNIELTRTLLELLGKPESLIEYVADRPGHDRRYAIDAAKLTAELGWTPRHSFEQGLEATGRWYLDHLDWCQQVRERAGYSGERIGTQAPAMAAG